MAETVKFIHASDFHLDIFEWTFRVAGSFEISAGQRAVRIGNGI